MILKGCGEDVASGKHNQCSGLDSLLHKLPNDLFELPLVLGKACMQHDTYEALWAIHTQLPMCSVAQNPGLHTSRNSFCLAGCEQSTLLLSSAAIIFLLTRSFSYTFYTWYG